jgi:hypothetical protein
LSFPKNNQKKYQVRFEYPHEQSAITGVLLNNATLREAAHVMRAADVADRDSRAIRHFYGDGKRTPAGVEAARAAALGAMILDLTEGRTDTL